MSKAIIVSMISGVMATIATGILTVLLFAIDQISNRVQSIETRVLNIDNNIREMTDDVGYIKGQLGWPDDASTAPSHRQPYIVPRKKDRRPDPKKK